MADNYIYLKGYMLFRKGFFYVFEKGVVHQLPVLADVNYS
jgi:hypothetical protein